MQPTPPRFDPRTRRRSARNTAIVLGLVAVAIYVGFIASGVLAS